MPVDMIVEFAADLADICTDLIQGIACRAAAVWLKFPIHRDLRPDDPQQAAEDGRQNGEPADDYCDDFRWIHFRSGFLIRNIGTLIPG